MERFKVGCGQITWVGVPEESALSDIAEAGYEGTPPKLTIKRPAAETTTLYRDHGLNVAPPYFSARV